MEQTTIEEASHGLSHLGSEVVVLVLSAYGHYDDK